MIKREKIRLYRKVHITKYCEVFQIFQILSFFPRTLWKITAFLDQNPQKYTQGLEKLTKKYMAVFITDLSNIFSRSDGSNLWIVPFTSALEFSENNWETINC